MSIDLPIDAIKADFLHAIKTQPTIILSAEPGAGKSTRLPLWLLSKELGVAGKIYLLQPRRVAVKNIANYLAQQLGEPVGRSVGYRVRNDTKVSNDTVLEVVTEGVLVQLMQRDPELGDTSIIILDEFHERSLNADLAFAIARDIQQGLRDDLTLILMSATLASDELINALPDAYCLTSSSRSFPVSVDYQPIKNIRLWREHTLSVIKKAMNSTLGSMLVFLPGSGDIRYLQEQLAREPNADYEICPLYGDLTLAQQQKAMSANQTGLQKVVLATNIAETSLTINGIQLVIDTGLEKVAMFDDNTLSNKLVQRNIAKSSAIQRMGRAGRLAEGHCIRLYAKEEYHRRPLHNSLPIQQADILPVVVEAARWGVSQLSDIPLLDLPNTQTEKNAWNVLNIMGIVDSRGRLTPHGEKTAALKCHVRFAHMIIKARELEVLHQCNGLTHLACILAALLEEKDIVNKTQAFDDCDIHTRITTLLAKPSGNVYQQIYRQVNTLIKDVRANACAHLPMHYSGVLLFLAFPERLAKARSSHGEYIASYGKGFTVNEHDALSNQGYIIAAHLMQYQSRLRVTLASAVDVEQLINWKLVELETAEKLNYDHTSGRILAVTQRRIGAVVVDEKKSTDNLNVDALFTIWQQQIEKVGLSFLTWKNNDKELLARWQWLNQTQPQLAFFDVSEPALMNTLEQWLKPYLINIKSKALLDKLNLSDILFAQLNYQQQQQFNQYAPRYFIGPTGRKCPIRYSNEHSPIVALPMQEVYGLNITPTVGEGKNKINLTLEFLSPAKRPIQTTADLTGFWQGSYKEVQKEMKAMYPKHYWPDDPANAEATNKTKRHIKT